jgi:RNA polymerase sigma-70 factor (sigma-E family)
MDDRHDGQPFAAAGSFLPIVDDFEEYVVAAWPRLLRSAWLLTGNWHSAEDLLQTVLAKVYGRWARLRDGAPDAYIRAALANTYLTWRRRRWRGEVPVERMPDDITTDEPAEVALRHTVAAALARLPRRQRAVLVLRFHADLTETDTARALGLSVGTVKSYTARALTTLRADPALRGALVEEVSW